ncbi:hypothetical protein FOCC_FOCC008516 [Frankliniella occidentalis]|uniref:Nucleolar transcription factor 1-A n=1 Tax=Frankliniella occidentalis TaxID=133901 RepID=A0A6J1S5I5_FRAOC|nr:nucleolar transcription factor 1-A [Frankliniella occidentalis]XP_052125353.1 nucleolar transcription factor 1-A [Frankliniella occidentalis]KAE8744875.1 hypothetical protein FOCC_FOCC008516 [Frankliniella occidentalis]
MVLKKRNATNIVDEEPKKKRKDEKVEESPGKRSHKKKEYVVKVKDVISEDEEEEEEEEEEEYEEEDLDDEVPSDLDMREEATGGTEWPQADLLELFNRMENHIPNNDALSFPTRADRLDWDEIAFNNYQPGDCKKTWTEISKKIRKFRLLREVLGDAREWARKPWTNFYSKQNLHPDMPRRPLTQFMVYYMEKKDKVAAQHPNLNLMRVSQIISRMYASLSDEKKEAYAAKAAALREDYEEKLKIFYEKHPEYKEIEKPMRKPLARTGLPGGMKKPRTPQQMFIDDRLEKKKDEPHFDKNQVTLNAKEQWKNLSEKKKMVWITWALEEEAKYLETIKSIMAENPSFEPPTYKPVLKKEEVKLKQRLSGKPQRPPNSGYSLYSRIMLGKCEKLRQLLPKERMREISIKWHAMTDAGREEYAKRVKYEQEQYKLNYATYLESLPEEERQEELMKTQTKKKSKDEVVVNNGKKSNEAKSQKSSKKPVKVERLYFPGEPQQPPVNAYDLFVESFVSDTKLSATEAPRFWEMLPSSDKAKFQRKLKELKEKYIKDYKKFLRSLDEDEVSKYNELQKRNKELEAEAQKDKDSDNEEEISEENEASSDDEQYEERSNNIAKQNANANENDNDSDSDEKEEKKSDSSSDSSSSSSDSSSSDSDSDSSSDDSDEENDEKKSEKTNPKKANSDSDSSDDE